MRQKQIQHHIDALAALLLFGGALVLGSAGIAALPSLKNNPRDILSRMEE